MSLMDRITRRGVHAPDASAEARAALRESIDVMVDHAIRERLRTAVAEVDVAIATIRAGLTSEPIYRTPVGTALDGLLDVRQTLGRRMERS
jgi:hypothetical protein